MRTTVLPARTHIHARNPLDTVTATALPTSRLWLDWKWIVIGACVAFTLYIAVIPLGFLLWQSFFTPQTATKPAVFTLGNYIAAYSNPDTARLFWNSVKFAAGVSAFSFLVGTTLAWMNERTNTPFKSLFYALSLIPLVIPGILFTVAWILLGSPKIGIINLTLTHWFNLSGPVFDVYSNRDVLTLDAGLTIAVGFVVSFLVAWVVVKTFIGFVGRYGLKPFGWYRIIAGTLIFVILAL